IVRADCSDCRRRCWHRDRATYDVRERRVRDRDRLHARRVRRHRILVAPDRWNIVYNPVSSADRGLAIREGRPGEAYARSEILVSFWTDLLAPRRILARNNESVQRVTRTGHQVACRAHLRRLRRIEYGRIERIQESTRVGRLPEQGPPHA